MAMMRPPSFISGAPCCARSASAKALVSRHQRQCLSFISIAGLSTPEAALEITMSRRSKDLRKPSNTSAMLSGSPALPCSAIAVRPSARTSAQRDSASS